jgi:hypothetical protein
MKTLTFPCRYNEMRPWLRKHVGGRKLYKLIWNGPDWCDIEFVNPADVIICMLGYGCEVTR